jgi:hypothetical protein
MRTFPTHRRVEDLLVGMWCVDVVSCGPFVVRSWSVVDC